jgi:ribosomal protein S12 methylthiotransferase accessory factor
MLLLEPSRRARKVPGSFDRCVPLVQTLALVPQLCERYGITRIADITHLDRIGIPVMSAIVPESPDTISVYNGKGTTREGAVAGAVMEAVERQIAAAPRVPAFLCDAGVVLKVIDPSGCHEFRHGMTLPVVRGVELLSGNPIDVPLALVQCPWRGERVIFGDSSNGLAAGNTVTEAVYHAVCELLERHVWAVAHALGYLRPRAIVSRFTGSAAAIAGFVDDPIASDIELPTVSAAVNALVEQIRRAGLTVRLRAFDLRPFPILLVATIADDAGGPSAAHSGLGCSWSPEHAAIRALTEAAQARAGDFHATREDLCGHDAPSIPRYGIRRTFGVPSRRWFYDAPAPVRALDSFVDRSSNDIARDVERLADALREADAGPLAIVDLSPAGLPLHVVRAVAPRLESPASGGRFGPTVRGILDLVTAPGS